ncbi:hypothetical protein Q73_15955 [Bacillus coahuilensis m2-6]|uniref:DUF4129 domain-containing transglutaminase family protein n=1 Tax=Bacillus coahuilensis TaxID=408580 RepID=UPI000750621D|nr:DUF4129 domain-containing transglutaminase family protein [Bacillus coahuilensis]KUP04364.1 hypothetical protein Q73_15955 [Bacillus coahuilensis m2-6]
MNSLKQWKIWFLYGAAFILLWEWLRPLRELTDTANLQYFVIFMGMSLLLHVFQVKLLYSWLLKSVYVVGSLYLLYFKADNTEVNWIIRLIEDLVSNVMLLVGMNATDLSFSFRSLLFFLLLWMMTYLIQYWLMIRSSMLLFFIMTVVYIGVLDTFTTYDGALPIVRTLLVGFLLLGILAFQKLSRKEGIVITFQSLNRWLVPLILMVVFSSSLALAAPKSDPIWPDPVPFLKSLNPDSGQGPVGVKKVGYGENDSQLGGAFIGDASLVFTAEVTKEHYWKVETKEVYTGKGWESGGETSLLSFEQEEDIPFKWETPNEGALTRVEKVENVLKYNHIAYPYGAESVTIPDQDEIAFNYLLPKDKIAPVTPNQEAVTVDSYEVSYREPVYNLTDLQAATSESVTLSQEFVAQYTQLPDTLPERVRELSASIVEGKETWWDQANAIEDYFRLNGYVYETSDVPVPEEGQDYVDQFLFESLQGYCDNYSTSMVVLLRSAGIPSRWVKGFTEGEYNSSLENGVRLYDVKNDHAHSWVEAYFPEVGWVMFEPTVGFTGSAAVNDDTREDSATTNNEETKPNEVEEQDRNQDVMPEDEVASGETATLPLRVEARLFFERNWLWIISLTILVPLLIFAMVKTRRSWIPIFYKLQYKRNRQNKEAFEKAYLSLLKQLERYGLHIQDGQTLRAYAKYIDGFFGTWDMARLTDQYEQVLYGGQDLKGNHDELFKMWENLINRTRG